jgi:DNA modification methylase
MKITDLKFDPQNANKGTDRGRKALAASLSEFGAGRSILVDKHGSVIAGNKTLEQAIARGDKEVVVVKTDGSKIIAVQRTDLDLKDAKAKGLAIADNRVGELGLEWDPEVLAEMGKNVDLAPYWSPDELEKLLGLEAGEAPEPKLDQAAALQKKWKTTLGQLWLIGPHRLLCGDSTKEADVLRLKVNVPSDEAPVLMFTDPPYGVSYDAEWRGAAGHATLGVNRPGKVAADDRSDWTEVWALFDTPVLYVWHASAFADVVMESLRKAGYEVRQQIIWHKTIPIMGRGAYHWQHEPCWYAVKKGATANWLGDRTQTTVWTEPPPNHIMAGSKDEKTAHPTQKPVALAIRAIRNHVREGGVLCDAFAGSGWTFCAAEQTGRVCYGMEIDPTYIAVILERLSDMGLKPKLAD